MKKLIAVLIALGFLIVMAFHAAAAWDAEGVAKMVEKVKKGEGFSKRNSIPDEQIIFFSIYVIDIKAQLCFTKGYSLVSCEKIKKAFPLIAPLITWED